MKMGMLALGAMIVGAMTAGVLAADLKDEMLAAHNSARAKHGVPGLSWSDDLAKTAQAWADRCVFEHSSTSYGENLAQGTGGYSGTSAVNDWYNEISAYDFSASAGSDATGHFTQVVWKGTKRVGCGVAQCSDGALYVCNYDPAGNFAGQYQDNVLPPK